jgi:hypothetical protein
MAFAVCFFIIAVAILRMSVTTFELPKKQENTKTEPIFVFAAMSSIYFVTSICSWLAVATVILLTTLSHYDRSCRRFVYLRGKKIVFVGACSVGVHTCLFISSVIGLIPVYYDVMVCVSSGLGLSLVQFAAAWIQETIMFQEVETTKREIEAKEVDDTLEYVTVC